MINLNKFCEGVRLMQYTILRLEINPRGNCESQGKNITTHIIYHASILTINIAGAYLVFPHEVTGSKI